MRISKEKIEYILHNKLNLHKVCTKWVSHILIEENKKNWVKISKQLLKILENGFQNIVTNNETWIYYFIISNKELNKTCIEIEKNRLQIIYTV